MFSYIKLETGSAVIIFIFLIGICYIISDSIPSNYTKLEESFGGYIILDMEKICKRALLVASQAGSLISREISLLKRYKKKYLVEETVLINKEGRRYLNSLYGNNEKFRDEIIIFVRDKTELDFEVILDRGYKTNTLKTTGKNSLTECVTSKDNTKDVIEILAKYVGIIEI